MAAGLTPTSYLVLGLVAHHRTATSYQLKQAVRQSIGYFWSFPHSQLYAEPARLVQLGLLAEHQEDTGRRRRTYSITESGRAQLERWLAEAEPSQTEIRDLALLKLFFGSHATPDDVEAVAEAAADAHAERLAQYEFVCATQAGADEFQLLTLELGLRYEREALRFWREVATRGSQPRTRPAPTSSDQ